MMKLAFPIVGALVLLACQPAFINHQPNEASPYFLVPAGTRMVLHQSVTIPAWQSEVYFQDGRAMPWSEVNIYLPHCALKAAAKAETARTIRPGTFTVKESHTESFFKQVEGTDRGPTVRPVAMHTRAGTVADLDEDDGMDYEVVAAVMQLSAADQPDVTAMICADWGLPQDMVHITVDKMRQALGACV